MNCRWFFVSWLIEKNSFKLISSFEFVVGYKLNFIFITSSHHTFLSLFHYSFVLMVSNDDDEAIRYLASWIFHFLCSLISFGLIVRVVIFRFDSNQLQIQFRTQFNCMRKFPAMKIQDFFLFRIRKWWLHWQNKHFITTFHSTTDF